MARIDRPHAGGQQREQRRLRLRQVKCGLMLAVDRDVLEVRVPDAARVPAEVLLTNQALPVHCTSLAVNGLPSCHFTPWRSLKVSLVRLASHAQLSARSGTMVSMLWRGLL